MSRPLKINSSSNVDQAHYDAGSQTLTVHFKSGGVYAYEAFPPTAAEAFESASSAGKHISTSIAGKYRARKISG